MSAGEGQAQFLYSKKALCTLVRRSNIESTSHIQTAPAFELLVFVDIRSSLFKVPAAILAALPHWTELCDCAAFRVMQKKEKKRKTIRKTIISSAKRALGYRQADGVAIGAIRTRARTHTPANP